MSHLWREDCQRRNSKHQAPIDVDLQGFALHLQAAGARGPQRRRMRKRCCSLQLDTCTCQRNFSLICTEAAAVSMSPLLPILTNASADAATSTADTSRRITLLGDQTVRVFPGCNRWHTRASTKLLEGMVLKSAQRLQRPTRLTLKDWWRVAGFMMEKPENHELDS